MDRWFCPFIKGSCIKQIFKINLGVRKEKRNTYRKGCGNKDIR